MVIISANIAALFFHPQNIAHCVRALFLFPKVPTLLHLSLEMHFWEAKNSIVLRKEN